MSSLTDNASLETAANDSLEWSYDTHMVISTWYDLKHDTVESYSKNMSTIIEQWDTNTPLLQLIDNTHVSFKYSPDVSNTLKKLGTLQKQRKLKARLALCMKNNGLPFNCFNVLTWLASQILRNTAIRVFDDRDAALQWLEAALDA